MTTSWNLIVVAFLLITLEFSSTWKATAFLQKYRAYTDVRGIYSRRYRLSPYQTDKAFIMATEFRSAGSMVNNFSLDKSIMPPSIGLHGYALCAVGLTLLMKVLSPAKAQNKKGKRTKTSATKRTKSMGGESLVWARMLVQSFSNLVFKILKTVVSVFHAGIRGILKVFGRKRKKAQKQFSLDTWNVCKLTNAEQLSDKYTKYRFEFPAYPDSSVSLDLGQELLLCSVDAKGRTLKEGFAPVSSAIVKGFFEIVCRNGGYISGDRFALALQFMSVGDELAVKAGKRQLKFKSEDHPITSISLITSGIGIAPTLQLLNEVLSDPDSTVQLMDVLWINEGKEDFILNNFVEDLEIEYADKLQVTRVVDRDVSDSGMMINDQLQETVQPYSYGSIAVVLAPAAVAAKSKALLSDGLGFPSENIVGMNFRE